MSWCAEKFPLALLLLSVVYHQFRMVGTNPYRFCGELVNLYGSRANKQTNKREKKERKTRAINYSGCQDTLNTLV
ncbi:hypothetical protein HOY82DRAFT_545265, partial [Tuber indicum]